MIAWPTNPFSVTNQPKLFRFQHPTIHLANFLRYDIMKKQDSYFNNYQGRHQPRGRTRHPNLKRRNRSKFQRRRVHDVRKLQKVAIPHRPFYQRWSVTGYKHLPPRPNISRLTHRRWQPVRARGGFAVINRRHSTHCPNHRRANPVAFRSRLHHRRYRLLPLKHKLSRMDHIIFWDIDNWSRLFEKLKFFVPINTFVWGFHSTMWNEPTRCLAFHRLINSGGFHKNNQSGRTKNAADFAMMLQIGKMDELLPNRVQFTIFSGDKGFQEAIHQMKDSKRIIRILNPHIPGWQSRLHHILNNINP